MAGIFGPEAEKESEIAQRAVRRIQYVHGERHAIPHIPFGERPILNDDQISALLSRKTNEQVETLERMAEVRGFNTAVTTMQILMRQFFGSKHQVMQIIDALKGNFNHDKEK